MNWLTHRRNKNAVLGGCIVKPSARAATLSMASPFPIHEVPYIYCDGRALNPYTMENQGNIPRCVAESCCYAVEQLRWREEHAPGGDLDAIVQSLYNECKRIDGNTEDGTTLESGLAAIRAMHLIPWQWEAVPVNSEREFMLACSFYGGVIGAYAVDDGWYTIDRLTGCVGRGTQKIGYHAVWMNYYDDGSVAGPNSWGEDNGWQGTVVGGRRIGAGYVRMTWAQWRDNYVYGYAIRRVPQ